MKQFKRALSVLMVLLCLTCLFGCHDTPDVQYSEGENALPEGASEEVNDLLDGLTGIHAGSKNEFGSAIVVTASLLDWCAQTDMTNEDLEKAAQVYYSMMGEESKMLFDYRLSLAGQAADKLGSEDTRAVTLENAQLDVNMSWEPAAFEKLECLFKANQ